jgi:NAD(P)-dependent dehydrogenase (short-subunit alcohol dehydrogenase family)
MSKHILITGCSTGFGFDAAKHFAKQGHQVYATMRNVATRNAAAAAALRSFAAQQKVQLAVQEMDVTSDASVAAAMQAIPRVDVLINNAGLGYGGPAESFTSQQVLAQLDLNVVGPLRVAKAVLPGMRARKSGLLIQVSSIAGRGAFPGFGVYHASKWGLEGLSEAMRYELAPLGIDVAIVEPGPFSTNFFPNLIAGADTEAAAGYPHCAEFGAEFQQMVLGLFADDKAPTDPKLVVDALDALVAMAPGTRPLRTIVGLDFGLQAMNDAIEPVRKDILAAMKIAAWDGVQAGK